ncbi:MAG TPA: DNA-processing protein DprA [Actinomycetota bacterium]|jgi:DNA processing protein
MVPRPQGNAALAAAVVVVEAGGRSGSLATARAAGSRGGGHVLAVPGAPWDPGARGCNDLIREGATLVRGLDDVLDELGGAAAATRPGGLPRRPLPPRAGRAARSLLTLLVDGQLLGPSRLAALSGLPAAEVAAALVELELAGFVRRLPGGVQAVAVPPD